MGQRVGVDRTPGAGQPPGALTPLTRRHPAEVVADIQGRYQSASAPAVFRNREAVGRFFDGFELVDPGLVGATDWRPDDLEHARPGGEWILAGVGRKP
ncbi:MAG: SAM-dependent methyltransferase [Actinomadura sp.]